MTAVAVFAEAGVLCSDEGVLPDALAELAVRLDLAGAGDLLNQLTRTCFAPEHEGETCPWCGHKQDPGKPHPKPPPPPPPPDPKPSGRIPGVDIPAELRSKIDEAVGMAEAVLAGAKVLARLEHEIDRELVALNRARGGDDDAFNRLCAATDPITYLENEIIALAGGLA